ncbi:hypothetical protein NDU88_002666, partial [Pleurodeles waltl]
GMAKWVHQKCGHLGEKATYRWAEIREMHIPLHLIKTVILQCPICQHAHQRSVP